MARHAWRACAVLAVARAELSTGCGVASTDWLEYVGMESLPLSLNGHNHILTLPRNYDASTPVPLVLYLHGWGGDASEAEAFASEARTQGVATAALEGGGPDGWKSWNAAGSSSSPGIRGATCQIGSSDYCPAHYAETCEACGDGCWWTTYEDSTQVLLNALDAVKKMLCADLGQVWVVGCSNGGMMVYEALADARTAGVFAGGVSIVGAPHPGFLRMSSAPAHLLGIWGLDDAMIPYAANTNRSGVAFAPDGDAGGWYYTAARNITQAWSAHHGGPLEPVPSDDGSGDVSCQTFVGASVETVECVVPDGHVCGRADRFRVHSGTTDRLEQ